MEDFLLRLGENKSPKLVCSVQGWIRIGGCSSSSSSSVLMWVVMTLFFELLPLACRLSFMNNLGNERSCQVSKKIECCD